MAAGNFLPTGRGQVDSRTRIRLSSKWISGAVHDRLWSMPFGSGFGGFRGLAGAFRYQLAPCAEGHSKWEDPPVFSAALDSCSST